MDSGPDAFAHRELRTGCPAVLDSNQQHRSSRPLHQGPCVDQVAPETTVAALSFTAKEAIVVLPFPAGP